MLCFVKNYKMKKTIQLFIILFVSFAYSQELKPVAEKVISYYSNNKSISTYNLFSLDNSTAKKEKYAKAASDISVLKMQSTELSKIVAQKPEAMEISFPFEGKSVTVQLVKNMIFTDDFKINTSKGEYKNYTPGVYYQGIVKDDPTSIVAFSFFKDDVVGVSSVLGKGNIVVGKVKNSQDFVSYSDSKLAVENPFTCGVEDLKENQLNKISFNPKNITSKLTNNCVRIYYEIGYGPYTQNGSNVTTATNWVTAMHNNISTLYANDGIKIALSSVFVWTTSDTGTYSGTPSNILNQFRNHTTSFNGDIGQLLRNPATTSIAWVNSVCTNYNYSYCGVNFTYSNVPTYSWNIEAMTHEMGHNLGSPHTHACAWNGDNTAIDGCGPASGNNEGCSGDLPTNGGTIMSYCHLVSGVGINFANGFGVQPGALIRNTIESKGCLGTNCTSSCSITVSDLYLNSVNKNSFSGTLVDDVSTTWKYSLTKSDGTAVSSGTTTSKTLSFSGLLPNTYYLLNVGTTCSGPYAFQKSLLVLTDDLWCGKTFIDTGGVSGNYSNSQSITKTFYPDNPSQKLSMTFTEFDLELNYDFMTIYNGDSTSSPVFANGNNLTGSTIPSSPFVSTDSTGAITVAFTSDEGVTGTGWNANISCSALSVEDFASKNGIQVYPNPAKNKLFVESKENIEMYSLTDVSGRTIITSSKMNSKSFSVDLSALKTGNYVMSFTVAGKTVSRKIIKQ